MMAVRVTRERHVNACLTQIFDSSSHIEDECKEYLNNHLCISYIPEKQFINFSTLLDRSEIIFFCSSKHYVIFVHY